MLDGMTNIKASEVLKEIKYYTEDLPPYSPDEVAEALEMAIQALEAQRNLTNEELYQSFIDLEAENERLHDALEAQPSEDCISREEALLALTGMDLPTDRDKLIALFTERIQQMPSVNPERPKGEWMECGGDEPWLKGYCCSLCNFTTTIKYNYCTCGAEMSGGGEE